MKIIEQNEKNRRMRERKNKKWLWKSISYIPSKINKFNSIKYKDLDGDFVPRSKIYEWWYWVFKTFLHGQLIFGQDPQAYKYLSMLRKFKIIINAIWPHHVQIWSLSSHSQSWINDNAKLSNCKLWKSSPWPEKIRKYRTELINCLILLSRTYSNT